MRLTLSLAALAACAPAPSPHADAAALPGVASDKADAPIHAWFTSPGTAPGEEVDPLLDDALIALLDDAADTVDLALYDFDHPGLLDAVLDAWERGVDVRLVSDADEAHADGTAALIDAGVPVALRPAGDRIQHHKFAVFDGAAVWTGSTNWTDTGLLQNDNNAVLVRSVDLADAYTGEVDQMVAGRFGRRKWLGATDRAVAAGDQTVTYHFSPQDDPVQAVVAAIDAAEESVGGAIFSFTHPDVVDALEAAWARGVDVAVVMDESQANGPWSVDEELAAAGVPVYIDGNHNASGWAGGKLHHKVLVVDPGTSGEVVLTGSANWSRAGTDDNDENLLEIRDADIVAAFADEVARVRSVATLHPDFAGEAPEVPEPVAQPEPEPGDWTLQIHEVLADPDGTDRGQEFVEIVNLGPDPVNLHDFTLGDAADPARHVFGERVLGPGEGVVVFDQGERPHLEHAVPSTSGYLSLNNSGETVVVADRTGAVVAEVTVGEAIPGVSVTRWPQRSAGAPMVAHDSISDQPSSPGTLADGRGLGTFDEPAFTVVLNEVMVDPEGTDRGQEYVELVNLGPGMADLTGFSLDDEAGTRHVFDGVVLAPGEPVVVWDTAPPAEVPGAVASSTGYLALNNAGDALWLRTPEGETHDTVGWDGSAPGVSWNRVQDGGREPFLVLHDEVDGAVGVASPGVRATGEGW